MSYRDSTSVGGSPKLSQLADNATYYMDPNVYLTSDIAKGTGMASRLPLKKGDLLFVDNPYALVPTPIGPKTAGFKNTFILCSRVRCSRKVFRSTKSITCSNKCSEEVVWCDSECQTLGAKEHMLECEWLKTHSKGIRHDIGEEYENFYSLWLIVRTLAQAHLEGGLDSLSKEPISAGNGKPQSNWNVVRELRSNQESWQLDRLEYWRNLVEKYLVGDHAKLYHSFNVEEMLTLVCQLETNHFDLWPDIIGVWPPPPSSANVGSSCYAYVMYLRTPFLNHSCVPNVSPSC